MRFLSLVLLTVWAAYGEAPLLDQGSNLMLRSGDMQFAMGLSQTAVGAAAVAQEIDRKSANPEVEAFGTQLSADYGKIRSGLTELVLPMRVTLPSEIPAKELSTLVKIRNSRPDRLDKTYMKANLKQTIRNIKSCKREIKKGRNPGIQRFAIETLPVLEGHLEKARSLYRAVEKRT